MLTYFSCFSIKCPPIPSKSAFENPTTESSDEIISGEISQRKEFFSSIIFFAISN